MMEGMKGSELRRDSFDNYRQRYRRKGRSDQTWGAKLELLAKTIPDRLAFIQGGRRLTWKQFNGRVNRLANALLDLRIKKGERVGIAGFNSIEWMESFFAISKIGAVPFNINPLAALDEIEYMIGDADAVAVIMEDEYARTIARITTFIASLRHLIVYGRGELHQPLPEGALVYEDLLAEHSSTKPKLDYKVTNEDFCCLVYGSAKGAYTYPMGVVWDNAQGVKGVEWRFWNVLLPLLDRVQNNKIWTFLINLCPVRLFKLLKPVRSRSWAKWIIVTFIKMTRGSAFMVKQIAQGKQEETKSMPVSPLFYSATYMQTFTNIVACVTTTVFLSTTYPFNSRQLLETIEREKVDNIMINGDAFAMPIVDELKKAKEEGRTYDLVSWRGVISSGVRWSPRVKRELCQLLPQLVIVDTYGCTEFTPAYSSAAVLEDNDMPPVGATLRAKGGLYSIQAPFKVINRETGKEVEHGTGEMGEFVAEGYVALGYWKRPEETKKCFKVVGRRRHFFTGDDGYVDKHLRFCFVGKGGDVVSIGGEKVYGEEVKVVIKTHPKVRDAAVVGVPDRELGEALAAIIELEKGEKLSERDVVKYCSQSLPAHKIPKHVMFVVSLPREATGKMEKRVLREFVESRLGSEAY